jgi:cytoskeleton protein RodZ
MARSIGKELREARARKEIELSEVERVTKIRARLLSALEEERWQDLPEPVYVRGFISTYARYLGLDEEPLLEHYREISGEPGQPAHFPYGVVHTGEIGRGRGGGPRPRSLVVAALVTVVLLGLVIAAVVGGTDSGGGDGSKTSKGSLAAKPGHRTSSSATTTSSTASTSSSTTTPSAVSVELRSTADVWVCLVDDSGRHLVNSETLPPGQTRGPFTGPGFDMTFGNGSVDLTVNGQPIKVPALSEPLGYRISTAGTKRLQPSAQPSCV